MAFKKGDIVKCISAAPPSILRDDGVKENVLYEVIAVLGENHNLIVVKDSNNIIDRIIAESRFRLVECAPPPKLHVGSVSFWRPPPPPKSKTIADKNDKDKTDLSLIPYVAMKEMAKALMIGEAKYDRFNYCKGHKTSKLVAAILRHAAAFYDGEDLDPEDGQHHVGAIMANCAMILRQIELGTHIDDRYVHEGTKNDPNQS